MVINHCKAVFARYGVPELVRSDNGPQFEQVHTSEFSKFARDYGFRHITSSPHFPQSNGFIEATVKIAKLHIKKNGDPYKALLEYRASPLSNGYSPAELLMGRRIRTTLPMIPQRYEPKLVDVFDLKNKEEGRREKQAQNYNRRHGAIEKDDFIPGELVWVRDKRVWATVREKTRHPRSYIVETPTGKLRRNTFHLTRVHRAEEIKEQSDIYPEDTNSVHNSKSPSPALLSENTTQPLNLSTSLPSPSHRSNHSTSDVSTLPSPSSTAEMSPKPSSTYQTRYGRQVKPVDRWKY